MTTGNLPRKDEFQRQPVAEYTLEKEIGRGKIGVVYLAFHTEIPEVQKACKIIPAPNLKDGWEKELVKVGRLNGIPQVVQHNNHGTTSLGGRNYVYILWEYVPGMNLGEYSKTHPESITLPFVENLLREVLVAFHAMKETGISHDDLHMGNILVHDNDPRLPDQQPRFKISDFGIGGSRNGLAPKDDYLQLALICHELLEKHVDPSDLDGKLRSSYSHLVEEFLPKYVIESDPTVGDFVRQPLKLREILYDMSNAGAPVAATQRSEKLRHPFDYLSCEHMGNQFDLLQRLYSQSFPGYDELLSRSNTILTGPRGCGKTTIFRNLSLKTRLLAGRALASNTEDFVGIYYHCNDLYYAFPYQRGQPPQAQMESIVHYFNLALACEILDTLLVAQRDSEQAFDAQTIASIEQYIASWLPKYQPPPHGTSVLGHLLAFVQAEKQRSRRRSSRDSTSGTGRVVLPLDFLPGLCSLLQKSVRWIGEKPFYFFVDDYSLPRISAGIQSTLNDLLLGRHHECMFKISTESVTSFHSYDSKNKLLDETREYDVIDLGDYFLHAPQDVRRRFLLEVMDNRLNNSEGIDSSYHDISLILGQSEYKSGNELAREIRKAAAGAHTYYYGWDIITQLCSGDVAHMLRLVREIFSLAGGYARFQQPGQISVPLDRRTQDRAIKELGNDFLARVEAVPETGRDLKRIAEAFGAVANWYLRTRDSKNESAYPPWQAFRIEMKDVPRFEDIQLERKYKDLLRCAVFLRDVRGKSQRGAVVPRLYLRRLLIPTFLLSPSQRDSIGLEVEEFFLLLRDPEGFVVHMKKKPNDLQGRLL